MRRIGDQTIKHWKNGWNEKRILCNEIFY
jgi:hypothetical protein